MNCYVAKMFAITWIDIDAHDVISDRLKSTHVSPQKKVVHYSSDTTCSSMRWISGENVTCCGISRSVFLFNILRFFFNIDKYSIHFRSSEQSTSFPIITLTRKLKKKKHFFHFEISVIDNSYLIMIVSVSSSISLFVRNNNWILSIRSINSIQTDNEARVRARIWNFFYFSRRSQKSRSAVSLLQFRC